MASGIKIMDSSGNVMVDSSSLASRILGVYNVPGTVNTYNISNDGFLTGTPFYVIYSLVGLNSVPNYLPTVTFSGNTMTINVSVYQPPCDVIYGVY